jgi:hypothetical protein
MNYCFVHFKTDVQTRFFFFFEFEEILSFWKAYFVGPDKKIKPRLFKALTKNACPDSNSRPAMQILNPLPSRYVS